MTATVNLKGETALVFDAIQETPYTTRGVLLSIKSGRPGEVVNCALIPADQVQVVLASLQLVARSLNLAP